MIERSYNSLAAAIFEHSFIEGGARGDTRENEEVLLEIGSVSAVKASNRADIKTRAHS